METYRKFFILAILSLKSIQSLTQHKTVGFGLNMTHFNDWKNGQSLNFFNPEIGFSKQLNNNNFRFNTILNVFYGEAYHFVPPMEGKVIYRLIFSNDYQMEYKIKDIFVGLGPSVRYRHERKILYQYPQPNPFEIVTDPKKSHVDLGGVVTAGYHLKFGKKSVLTFKLTYRQYNRGVNPISAGVSYGVMWL